MKGLFKKLISMSFVFGLMIGSAQAEVSGKDVHAMLNDMVAKGIITKEEANKAKQKIAKINAGQWKKINAMAARTIASDPSMAKNVNFGANAVRDRVDFDSNEYKFISQEVENILKN